jgi:hypothetical protein
MNSRFKSGVGVEVGELSKCINACKGYAHIELRILYKTFFSHLAGVQKNWFGHMASFLFWRRIFQNSGHEIPEWITGIRSLEMRFNYHH